MRKLLDFLQQAPRVRVQPRDKEVNDNLKGCPQLNLSADFRGKAASSNLNAFPGARTIPHFPGQEFEGQPTGRCPLKIDKYLRKRFRRKPTVSAANSRMWEIAERNHGQMLDIKVFKRCMPCFDFNDAWHRHYN